WMPLAVLFAIAGLCGLLPVFQANQAVQLLRESFAVPLGWVGSGDSLLFDGAVGIALALAAAAVIAGRIQRIGRFTLGIVTAMVLFYLALTLIVIAAYWQEVPAAFALIFRDAFSGEAVAGGALGGMIAIGISRG